jgi:hypothetical protein
VRPESTLRAARAAGHLLHRPAGTTPEAIVRRLLAVQCQDLTQGRRALRARGEGFTAADVDEVLAGERSIVTAWLNRGTIHMAARDDYPWLLGLTTPTQLTGSRRRLEQLGVTTAGAERAVTVIERELAEDGPLTRRELRERMAAKGLPTKGQAFIHQLFLAALRGVVVIGPLVDGKPAVALTRDWLGIEPTPALEGEARDTALAELARRYLAAHGPASDRDLAWWAGLPLRDARLGLNSVAVELTELDGDLVDLAKPDRPHAPSPMTLRLLPTWDAYLLGWKERSFLIADKHVERIYVGGMIGPAITVDGRVAGTWKAQRRDGRLVVEAEPFGRVSARELEAERADLARFEGLDLAP